MRIALISDIHGNLVALDTALGDIQRQGIDEIICLGDVAAIGPQPKETLARLREIKCQIVMGNADAELIQPGNLWPSGRDKLDRRTREVVSWCRSCLSEEDLSYIRSFVPAIERPLGSNTALLCFHGSPRSYNDMIMWTTPAAELDQMIGDARATILAGGHTHVQMIRRHRDRLVLNAGSVGLPYDKNPWSGEVSQDEIRYAEWAEYALVAWQKQSLTVELRRVKLDLAEVADAAIRTRRPYATQWTAAWAGRLPLLQSLTS